MGGCGVVKCRPSINCVGGGWGCLLVYICTYVPASIHDLVAVHASGTIREYLCGT